MHITGSSLHNEFIFKENRLDGITSDTTYNGRCDRQHQPPTQRKNEKNNNKNNNTIVTVNGLLSTRIAIWGFKGFIKRKK